MLAGSPVVRVIHFVQELVQFVLVPDWFKDLLPIQVVSNVREVFVPVHRDVAHGVPDVLHSERSVNTPHRSLMVHFHYSAERGLARPVFGCVSTRRSSGLRVLFHSFLALQNRGSFRANNRAEYAKLVRESLATTTR